MSLQEGSKGKKICEKPEFWLFLAISGLFVILFIRCIAGKLAYCYIDIGSDTFFINYPLFSMFSDFVHGTGYDSYVLRAGLGTDISSYLYQYWNPLNLLVILVPRVLIPWAILFITYVKLLMMGFGSFALFRRWMKHDWAALYAALFWAFSGYVTLWGQHYGFGTSLALFTIFLFLVHVYVEEQEKSHNRLLVLWITLMLFSNYYFLYISGIAGVFYIILYLFWKREKLLVIGKKIFGLGCMGALGLTLGGVCLVPIMNTFFSSVRSEEVAERSFSAMLQPHSLRYWTTFLGRFFSNNIFGVGNAYDGLANYYEAGVLSVSVLALPAVVYLLKKKKTRWKTAFLLMLSLVLLAFPVSGFLLNMNPNSFRYTFLICFMEAAAVGFFLKDVLTRMTRRTCFRCLAASGFVVAMLTEALYAGENTFGFTENTAVLALFYLFFLLYALVFLFGFRWKKKKGFPVFLLALICAELVISDFPTINQRILFSREMLNTEIYNDGSQEAYEAIAEEDSSVFRVAKNYNIGYFNDGMAQGYPGFAGYLSTNSKEVIQLKELFGGEGVGDNIFCLKENHTILRSLLGMKYLLADPEISLPGEEYTFVASAGRQEIYRYEEALPFGYFYDAKFDKEEFEKMTPSERERALLYGFCFMEESGEGTYSEASLGKVEEVSVLDHNFKGLNCKAEASDKGILLSEMGNEPSVIWYNLGDAFSEGSLFQLSLTTGTLKKKVELGLYYTTDDGTVFSDDRRILVTLTPDCPSVSVPVPSGTTNLKIQVYSKLSKLRIKELAVGCLSEDALAYAERKESQVSDTTFADNRYTASVVNPSDSVQMLCVPLVYSEGWQAQVDGEEKELFQINGGLCGLEISSGAHKVELCYEIPNRKVGIGLSAVGGVLFLVWCLLERKTHKGTGM